MHETLRVFQENRQTLKVWQVSPVEQSSLPEIRAGACAVLRPIDAVRLGVDRSRLVLPRPGADDPERSAAGAQPGGRHGLARRGRR